MIHFNCDLLSYNNCEILSMSTFSGFLDGIKYVSVDRFTELNLQSKVFFLSHCHMDHMIGLNEITSEMELPGPLYLSEVSKVIVRRKYPAIKNMISLNLGGKLTFVKFPFKSIILSKN